MWHLKVTSVDAMMNICLSIAGCLSRLTVSQSVSLCLSVCLVYLPNCCQFDCLSACLSAWLGLGYHHPIFVSAPLSLSLSHSAPVSVALSCVCVWLGHITAFHMRSVCLDVFRVLILLLFLCFFCLYFFLLQNHSSYILKL